MSAAAIACRVDGRRAELRRGNAHGVVWNGIDYVEGYAGKAHVNVQLLCSVESAPASSVWSVCCERSPSRVTIDAACPHGAGSQVMLQLSHPLPAGTYVLRVDAPGFDPRHSSYRFTIESDTTEVDPKPRHVCPPARRAEPEINYLAKDYGSFRQLLFDRLAQVLPEWRERHIPDVGVTLVELLAYIGDYLSYYQDAVGTEAYLETARQRVSVRRHARLIDYDLDEGCNARTFVHVEVDREGMLLDPDTLQFITQLPDRQRQNTPVLDRRDLGDQPHRRYPTFEPIPLARPCRPAQPEIVRNVPGFCGWLLDAGRWLLDLLPEECGAQVKSRAGAESAADMADLFAPVQHAVALVVEQDCLVRAWMRGAAVTADAAVGTVTRAMQAITDRPLRNRCLLYEAASHLVVDPQADRGIRLSASLNKLEFYTWSQQECCLPVGATRATLRNRVDIENNAAYVESNAGSEYLRRMARPTQLGQLQAGDILVLAEQKGPKTHNPIDADPARRQAVRLARVEYGEDPVTHDPIVEIEWHAEDALTFPLCLSSRHELTGEICCDISVAYGNIVLVDHGATVEREILGAVPAPPPVVPGRSLTIPSRPFRPRLSESDITYAERVDGCPSAKRLLRQKAHCAQPQVWLNSSPVRSDDAVEMHRGEIAGAVNRPLVAPGDLVAANDLAGLLMRLDAAAIRRLQRLAGGNRAELNPWIAAKNSGAAYPAESLPLDDAAAALRAATSWELRPHLFDSNADDNHAALEIDNDRRGFVRFGNGTDAVGSPGTELEFAL